ncbi:DUF6228 family protein [Umezawaea sp. NPDC059074]|uniref:DUF6228 family protein n=1 Tax=Umezawaea sp. NPDC059074 TaxID=3346716 RepID=UPI003687C37A
MECEYSPDDDGDTAVALECSSGAWVRLWNRHDPWGDGSVRVCIEIGALGLRALVHDVTVGIWADEFSPFLEEVAESFTGWEGTRTWRSTDSDLEVTAKFRSWGHVDMTWTVAPWRESVGRWNASVVLTLEAGEQMRGFAADVRRFLRPEASR